MSLLLERADNLNKETVSYKASMFITSYMSACSSTSQINFQSSFRHKLHELKVYKEASVVVM